MDGSPNCLSKCCRQGGWVLTKRGVYWSIEQPEGSVMFQHLRLRKMIKKSGAKAANFEMGTFGAPTPKRSIFVGTAPWLGDFDGRKLSSEQKRAMKEANPNVEVTKKYKTKDGKQVCQILWCVATIFNPIGYP